MLLEYLIYWVIFPPFSLKDLKEAGSTFLRHWNLLLNYFYSHTFATPAWCSLLLPNCSTPEDSRKYGAAKWHFRTIPPRSLCRASSAQNSGCSPSLFRAVNWVDFATQRCKASLNSQGSGRRDSVWCPGWIFFGLPASLLFCNALQSLRTPGSQRSAGPPARQEEDHTAIRMTLRLFFFSTLFSGVWLSHCSARILWLAPCLPFGDRAMVGMRVITEEQQSRYLLPMRFSISPVPVRVEVAWKRAALRSTWGKGAFSAPRPDFETAVATAHRPSWFHPGT